MGEWWARWKETWRVWWRKRWRSVKVTVNGETRSRLEVLARSQGRPLEGVMGDLLHAALEQQGQSPQASPWSTLTPRERDVLALSACGYSRRQIAARLVLSKETVRSHLRRALRKYGVSSQQALRARLNAQDLASIKQHLLDQQ